MPRDSEGRVETSPQEPKAPYLMHLWKGKPRTYPKPEERTRILDLVHQESHQQPDSMCKRLKAEYYWEGMKKDAENWCRQCSTCQDRHTMVTADGEMQPIPTLPKGERWHLDLIGPLKEGQDGFKYAAVAN